MHRGSVQDALYDEAPICALNPSAGVNVGTCTIDRYTWFSILCMAFSSPWSVELLPNVSDEHLGWCSLN